MRKYKLVIVYDPKNDTVESIEEYIIEDEVEFIVDDEEIDSPEDLKNMIVKYCNDSTVGLS